MKMLLTEKTKQEKIMNEVQKKRNLFGLGLTSLIAACGATDKATNDTTEVVTDKRPTTAPEAVPLTATATYIAVAAEDSTMDEPDGRAGGKKNLKITIAASTEVAPTPVTNDFEMTFRNGDHSAARFAEGVNPFVYKGLTADASQYDLVVLSKHFGDVAGNKTGAMYILWDIGAGGKFGDVTSSVTDETVPKHLKVVVSDSVDLTTYYAPTFYKDLGGDADQTDLALQSSSNQLSIIWDVTKYADVAELGGTLLDINPDTTDASPGILHITTYGELNLGDVVKINNNEGYDMIVKALNISTYILWDVAKYYDADASVVTPAVDLSVGNPQIADGTLTAIHGALAITGDKKISIKKAAGGGGFTDIDGGGTNDIAFAYDGNTYILFGEKVANIDEESGTAISHKVSLGSVANGEFYNKAGDDRTAVTAAEGGFFHYDLDGAGDNAVVENVGYRFATNVAADKVDTLANIKTTYEDAITAVDGALSEEAYWDIA